MREAQGNGERVRASRGREGQQGEHCQRPVKLTLLLYVGRNVLFNVKLLHGLGCCVDGVLLHVLGL